LATALADASQPEAGPSGQEARSAGSRENSAGTSSSGPAGLAAVRIASQMAATTASTLRLSVERAREAGRTWHELGDVLGVSRQAAFQRFGHPVDPRTGQPMSDAILPGAAAKATGLMINWIEERYDEVMPELNELTLERLATLGGLAAAWAMLIGTVGAYEGMGEAAARQAGDLTIVDIPMTFESGEMKGRVVYDRQGKVAGLFVLPPGSL
jgi:Protein of unknown function (DUF3887)